MHATLAWQGSLVIADAASDVIAVLTGETDVNNLSSQILPGGTTIASSFPAGWEVWDDDTGVANEWVLRAPTVDDATQYKYVRMLFTNSSSYLRLTYAIMEDWDKDTNTPTNQCTVALSNTARFPATSYTNNTLDIIATARFMMFRNQLYISNISTFFPCIEITRTHPCLQIGTGRVPAVHMEDTALGQTSFTQYLSSIPRMLDDAGTADLLIQDIRAVNSGIRPMTNVTNEFDNLSAEKAYDSVGAVSYGIHAILFERRDLIGQVCGDSSVSDLHIMQGEVIAGYEDRTLHTLDLTDDSRVMWKAWNQITTHGNMRFVVQAE